MSAFDEFTTKFRRTHGQDLDRTETRIIKVSHNGTYIALRAWNAALDELEGLADGWAEEHAKGWTNAEMGYCAKDLKARIKELRETTNE